MSLNLIGTAGLFTRLGHLIHGVNGVVNAHRGAGLANRTDIIQEDYKDSDQNLIDSLYSTLSGEQSSQTSLIGYWRSLAQNTVTQMVNAYQPQLNRNYQNALFYLFNYLVTNDETVVRNTISTTVTPAAGNSGNGAILVDNFNAFGYPQEYMFNEQVSVLVTRDAQNGSKPGQELLSFAGTYGTTDMLHWLWPQGSNAQMAFTAVTPTVENGSGNKNWLINGTMESYTLVPNVPDAWHVYIGTPGTTILEDATDFYNGAHSVKFVGNGTEKTSIWTQFGVDFSGKVVPVDQLAVNLWYKLSVVPAAGVLTVSLVDGTGTTLLDSAGNPSALSVTLSGTDTSWHALSGFLRTPQVVPAVVYLKIELSTALSAGSNLNIDWISMARPMTFYPGGPQIACFSGDLNWMVGDRYTVLLNNDFNGLMQTGCNQLLNLSNYGLIFPSTTGAATIPDTLVV